jgi:hypothetical protein
MENSIKAADGRYYSEKDFYKSFREAMAVALNPSRSSPLAKKLMAIDNMFDLSGKTSRELFDRGDSSVENTLYFIQDKTEFVNVASQAGAFLRGLKATDENGNESNVFESIDENGKIKDGWKIDGYPNSKEALFDIKARLDELRNITHGDYSNPMKIKSSVWGRMVMQFRTWIPEMYVARWGKEEYNYILKENIKGRWRSFNAINIFKGSEFEGNQYTAIDNALYLTGQLAKKILFMKTDFSGRMSPVDAANMKANMMELHFLLGSIMLILLLGLAFDDEDDKKKFRINTITNLILRLQTDILMFVNPLEFESLSKNMIPVFGIMNDIGKLTWSIKEQFGDNPDYRTGSYRSMNKAAVNSIRMIPVLNQGLRIFQYNDQIHK